MICKLVKNVYRLEVLVLPLLLVDKVVVAGVEKGPVDRGVVVQLGVAQQL
jgi:hypothetical protein